MKYKTVKLLSGKYAVSAGRKQYFSDTVRDDEKEAEKEALIMSMQWYNTQRTKAELVLLEKYGLDYDEIGNLLA